MKKSVEKLTYNWHENRWGGDSSEEYATRSVCIDGVVSIVEDTTSPVFSYLVTFESGKIKRVFNPNTVTYDND